MTPRVDARGQALDAQPARLVTSRQHGCQTISDAVPLPCGCYPGQRWYVAWTEPQAELRAIAAINARTPFRTYLPLVRERDRSHRAGAPPWHSVPLWPRYLCVQFDATTDPWGTVWRLPAIGGLIRHAPMAPTPLPHGTVEDLMARTSSRGCVDDIGDRAPDMPVGAAVSWNGLDGIVTASAPNRIRVLMKLFQRVVPVSMAPEAVEAA